MMKNLFSVTKLWKAVLLILLAMNAVPSSIAITGLVGFPKPANDAWSNWKYSKIVTLVEDSGLERKDEVVSIKTDFDSGKCLNAANEVRVVDDSGKDVVSQVYDEVFKGGWCVEAKVAFLVDQAPNSRKEYTIYYGNEKAEKPEYKGIVGTKKDGSWQLTVGNGFVAINPDGLVNLYLFGSPVGTFDLATVYDSPWTGGYYESVLNELVKPPQLVITGPLVSAFTFEYSSQNLTNTARLYIYYRSQDLRLFVEQDLTARNPLVISSSGRGDDYLRLVSITTPFKEAYQTLARRTIYGLYNTQENISANIGKPDPLNPNVWLPESYLYSLVDWLAVWGSRGVAVGMLASFTYSSKEGADWWIRGGYTNWDGRITTSIDVFETLRTPFIQLKVGEGWRAGVWIYAYMGYDQEGMALFKDQIRAPLLVEDLTFHVRDESGVGIKDATVEVYNSASMLKGSSLTDSNGYCHISGVKSDFYQVLVMANGFKSYYNTIMLIGGVTEITLKTTQLPALTLMLYWPNGSALVGADVSIRDTAFKGYGAKLGVYEFSGLTEGSAQIKATYSYQEEGRYTHTFTNETTVSLSGHVRAGMILTEPAAGQPIEIIAGVAIVAIVAVVVVYKVYLPKRRKPKT